ncbi:pre-mRNA-splicing regulator WTAP-like, partial [Elysia marginata]
NRDRDREQDDQSSGYSHSHSKNRKRPAEQADEDETKDEEGKTKLSGAENARREHTLVMRLTNKEQELQDCMNQIQEMKQAQTQNTAQLRSMLLDPAINLVFQRMAKEMDDHKDKLKQKQNDLTAWKFTPDSQTGMRVMARCRMLLQENQELGKMISSGRTARLEGEIVLHKALATEMKKNQKELDEFVGELEEDVEGMQGMIFMLRQQLKEAQEQITRLQAENEQLRTLSIPPDPEPGGSSVANSSSTTPLWGDSDHNSAASTPVQSTVNAQGKTVSQKRATLLNSQNDTHSQAAIASESQSSGIEPSAQGNLLLATQTFEDFKPGVFASKVTPDSGIHTQEEEEDISEDASDFVQVTSRLDTHQPSEICDRLKPAEQTVTSTGNSSIDSAFSLVERAAQKLTPPPMLSRDIVSPQSTDSKSDSQIENVRTTPASAPVAISNSTGLSNHHPLSSSTQKTSAMDISLDRSASTQGSNNVANLPATTHLENQSPLGDDALVNSTASQQSIDQDENKSELHASLGLDTNPKLEEDKMECQTTLGLVNGNAKVHT